MECKIGFCRYQDEDFEILQRIKKDCFKWYVEKIYGWDDEKQIEFSQNFVREHKKDMKVIVCEDQKIGVFTNYIDENNESVISLFYIDKKFQNQGIGTNILKEQLKEDERNCRNTILQVFKENKARFLYEKMGFEIYHETETHYKMRKYWKTRKRFANDIGKAENVLEMKQNMKSVKEKDFLGDIYLNEFVKMSSPAFLENGLCVRNNHYKWLQFYDDTSKVCLTTIYNEKNEIVEWYFDIARKIGKENGIPYEDDLYLDVVLKPNGEIVLLDENELKEAFERMEMTKKEFDEAYETARNLVKRLVGNEESVKRFTDKYLRKMLKKEEF